MWVAYALVTVFCWGLYGAFLHKGAMGFANDRMKAFLFVGVAYFLIAVLAPLALIAINGKDPKWEFKPEGIKLSIFAGAPVIAAIYGLILKPPEGGLSNLDPKFIAGLVMAAAGGCMVTLFKPS